MTFAPHPEKLWKLLSSEKAGGPWKEVSAGGLLRFRHRPLVEAWHR